MEHATESTISSGEYRVTTSDNGNPNLTVVVRVRPENSKEAGRHRRIVKALDEHVLVFDPAQNSTSLGSSLGNSGRNYVSNKLRAKDCTFAFDHVFDGDSTQQDVYEHTTKGLVDTVLNGFNATVFAYGATGSGKTHTMIGNGCKPGVMVLTMRDLFEEVGNRKEDAKIKISISYLEVYNETIRDLFIENSPPLMLCEDKDQNAQVTGLSQRFPQTAEEVFELLEFGNRNRRQSPTAANEASSRSHAVLQIMVTQKDRTANVSADIKIGKLSLIDLAGSERAAVSQNRGDRLKEGANINRSLLALGNCINSLGENYRKGQHVPYRNSKLTRLLKDSLGGNCKTVMIAAISPSSMCYEDTLNTLKYANRAKNIKTKVSRNVVNVKYHISKYTQIIAELRNEVSELKSKLAQRNSPPKNQMSSGDNEDKTKQIAKMEANMSQLREIIQEQFKILEEHGLVNDRLDLKVKQAWVPVRAGLSGSAQRIGAGEDLIETEESPPRSSIEKKKRDSLKEAFFEAAKSPRIQELQKSPFHSLVRTAVSPFIAQPPMRITTPVSAPPLTPDSYDSPFTHSGHIFRSDGKELYLLTPRSPRDAKGIVRPLSKKQLENITENVVPSPRGRKQKSILKKVRRIESNVDNGVAKVKKQLITAKKTIIDRAKEETKSVLFAFSPECKYTHKIHSYRSAFTKVSRKTKSKSIKAKRASFMEPTKSSNLKLDKENVVKGNVRKSQSLGGKLVRPAKPKSPGRVKSKPTLLK